MSLSRSEKLKRDDKVIKTHAEKCIKQLQHFDAACFYMLDMAEIDDIKVMITKLRKIAERRQA